MLDTKNEQKWPLDCNVYVMAVGGHFFFVSAQEGGIFFARNEELYHVDNEYLVC